MVSKHLPEGADIHGGGTDIRFPHHENELAQSTAAHPERTFVRAWAHHGMVTLGGSDKMAKSIGNVLDVQRAVELHGSNAIRMWLLQSHYSQPIEYSEEILEEKRRSFERLQNLYQGFVGSTSSSELSDRLASGLTERFDAAMQDDLNTPEAIAALFDVAGRAGREISARPEAAGEFASLAEAMEEVMTIFGFDLARELSAEVEGIRIRYSEDSGEQVLEKVAARETARREKDWAIADRLRDELYAEGWFVEDTSEGPILRRR
jgi:cysteinyl-tRNA synthetase